MHRRDVYLLVMSFIIDSSLLPTWWWGGRGWLWRNLSSDLE